MATTSTLGLTLLEVGQAEKEAVINGNMAILDGAFGGLLSKNVAGGANVALTATEARNGIIVLTGALTGNINVTVPDGLKKSWVVRNSTSGSFTITFKTASGTGVTVTQSASALVYSDGTNVKHVMSTDAGSPAKFLREDGIFATVTGGGGSGDQTYTDTYANRPSPTNDGDLFLPSNGYALDRADGSAWAAWGPVYPLKRPVLGDFTAVNQGGATISDARGALEVVAPVSSGDNLRIWKKAEPATPYTVTMAVVPTFIGENYVAAGLGWRESSSGKVANISLGYSTGFQLAANKWTNATTFSANYKSAAHPGHGPIWLRIQVTGGNRLLFVSSDGFNFVQFHTISETDFLTPDEILFFINVNNTSHAAAMTVIHWEQA